MSYGKLNHTFSWLGAIQSVKRRWSKAYWKNSQNLPNSTGYRTFTCRTFNAFSLAMNIWIPHIILDQRLRGSIYINERGRGEKKARRHSKITWPYMMIHNTTSVSKLCSNLKQNMFVTVHPITNVCFRLVYYSTRTLLGVKNKRAS